MERKKFTAKQAREAIDAFARRDMDKFARESLKRRQKEQEKNTNLPFDMQKPEVQQLQSMVK